MSSPPAVVPMTAETELENVGNRSTVAPYGGNCDEVVNVEVGGRTTLNNSENGWLVPPLLAAVMLYGRFETALRGVPLMRPVSSSNTMSDGSCGWIFQLVAGPPEFVGVKPSTDESLVITRVDDRYWITGITSTTVIVKLAGSLVPPLLLAVTR